MKVKNIVLGVVCIIVLGIVFVVSKKPQDSLEGVLGAVSFSQLPSGTYFIEEGQHITWTGTRTFLGNYHETGVLVIKQGEFVVEDEEVGGVLVIDMTSLAVTKTMTGYGFSKLTEHLATNFFEVADFPEARFVVYGVTNNNEGVDVLVGDLTLKGVTLPLEVPVELSMSPEKKLTLDGEISFDRTLWGVTSNSKKFFSTIGEHAVDDIVRAQFTIAIK